jgi:hypothetical protein
MKENQLYAYALGYYQGRVVGQYEYEGYEYMSDKEQHSYRLGYDRGIFDYCDQNIPAESLL